MPLFSTQFGDIKVIGQDDDDEDEDDFDIADADGEAESSLSDRTCGLCKKSFVKPSQLARVSSLKAGVLLAFGGTLGNVNNSVTFGG